MTELVAELRIKCQWCTPCHDCYQLMMRAADEIDRLQREKDARVYYQDIVYVVCNALDSIKGRDITKGQGVVCGTLEIPSTEVQERMEQMLSEIKRLRRELDEATTELSEVAGERNSAIESLRKLRASQAEGEKS